LEFQLKTRAIVSTAGLVGAALLTANEARAQYDGARWNLPGAQAAGRRAIATPTVHPRVTFRRPYYYDQYYGQYYGGGYYYDQGYRQPYQEGGGNDYSVTNYNIQVTFGDASSNSNQKVFLFPSPQYRTFVPQPVAYTLMPAYVLSDGTVIADFGLGFEPVRRFCGDQFVITGSPQVTATNGHVVPSGAQRAPNQATQSAQNATAQRFPVLTTAAQGACYTLDSNGRYFVIR
jgi:hypothetical protein